MVPFRFRKLGAFGVANTLTFGWVFVIMNNWYSVGGRPGVPLDGQAPGPWYANSPPDWGESHGLIFVLHVIVALGGATFLWPWLYRHSLRRMVNYDARKWKEKYIDRRRDREMREVLEVRRKRMADGSTPPSPPLSDPSRRL
jgi:hypothetical protein